VLRFSTVERGPEVVVALEGEITNDPGAPDWPRRLRDFLMEQYVTDGVSAIRLDLGAVTRLDVKGVATLLRLARAAKDHRKTLTLRNVGGQPASLLERVGAMRRLGA
jgi:ABC-type transporter Mla MlaB component